MFAIGTRYGPSYITFISINNVLFYLLTLLCIYKCWVVFWPIGVHAYKRTCQYWPNVELIHKFLVKSGVILSSLSSTGAIEEGWGGESKIDFDVDEMC